MFPFPRHKNILTAKGVPIHMAQRHHECNFAAPCATEAHRGGLHGSDAVTNDTFVIPVHSDAALQTHASFPPMARSHTNALSIMPSRGTSRM